MFEDLSAAGEDGGYTDTNDETDKSGGDGGGDDGSAKGGSPLRFNPTYTFRLPSGRGPPTAEKRLAVGSAWGAYTWYLYYYTGFSVVQDLVDKALIAMAVADGDTAEASALVTQFPVFAQQMPIPYYVSDVFGLLIGVVLPLIVVISWLQSFTTLVKGLVHERETSLTDAMATYGLKPGVNSVAWFISTMVLFTVDITFLVLYLRKSSVLPHSSVTIVFILFELFAAATICMGFALSTLFAKARLSSAASGVIYLASFVPFLIFYLEEASMTCGSKILLGLLPPTAFSMGAFHIARLEQAGTGVTWNNTATGLGTCDNYSVATAMWTLLLDVVLYGAIAWYGAVVWTGVPGSREQAWFLFQPSWWKKRWAGGSSKMATAGSEDGNVSVNGGDDDGDAKKDGVVMDNVEVIYRRGRGGCGADVHALKGLSLTLEHGTLTTLLGQSEIKQTLPIENSLERTDGLLCPHPTPPTAAA